MIDKATVQRILASADIVEVVSDYVHLVKRGSNYMGLCPFHNEKTPSFSVSRSRNICHCFSCGKGGSPVNFIMEKEGVNYHDALIHLADKYGIKVEERQLTDEERARQSEREAMLVANDWAMRRMQQNLTETEEGRNVGMQYLVQRGVTMEAIKAFRLGYALDKPDDMVRAAGRDGYGLELLSTLGICGVSQSGRPYDRFRGRIIFPVLNSAGKVIAFGGRGIKGEAAKYINSPESTLYRKSNELYGVYQARNAIVREKRCFLVEGYMDVIGMWQAGMQNVVASSGTSLTEGQIALIHRFTDNVTLIYDGDAAGIKASLRGIDLLLSQKLNIMVLLLPDGDDPDSFARKHTPEEFREYVAKNETDFIDFEINILTSEADTPHARAAAVKTVVRSVASVADPIQRQIYIQQCSRRLDISENLLTSEVKKARVSVVDEMRRRRDMARISREREADAPQASPDVAMKANDGGAAKNLPDRAEAKERSKDSDGEKSAQSSVNERNRLISLEENVLAYCVKYGMVTFCQSVNAEGDAEWLNVVEYVRDELAADGIGFSSQATKHIFDETLTMTEAYREAEAKFLADKDAEFEAKMKKWYAEMAESYASVADIESKEQDVRAEIEKERYDASKQFAISYASRVLGSHPDDSIRHFALKVITPRYKLSRYHAKTVKVQLEEDRIEELIPRAISEWKDGILATRFADVQEELRAATLAGDTDKAIDCMSRLKEITELRSAVAKTIGERIVLPRT